MHSVFWHEAASAPGFWSVRGHREAAAVLRDAARFSSAVGSAIEDPSPEARAHIGP